MKWSMYEFHVFFIIALSLIQTTHLTKLVLSKKDFSVSIIFVGDINFGSRVKYFVNRGYNNYNDTMRKVAGIIRKADIAVGNLEGAFVTKEMQKDRFKGGKVYIDADYRSVSAIQFAGFDIMSLANNHLNDYGDKPVNFTRFVLDKAGIKSFGFNFGSYDSPQQSLILKRKGIKIGFLGYCDVYSIFPNWPSCSTIRKMYEAGPAIYSDLIAKRDVEQLKGKGVDVVIVYMHWGSEFSFHPNESQKRIAKYFHSIGVSVVIGAHPHVLQGHIFTTHRLTAYSIGNFLFSPTIHTKWKRFSAKKIVADFEKQFSNTGKNPTTASRILRMQITRDGVASASYLPVTITFDNATKLLQPVVNYGKKWIDICSKKDKACLLETK